MAGLPTICHTIGKAVVQYKLPKESMNLFPGDSNWIISQTYVAMLKQQLVSLCAF
jgi:hypothetical protein